MFRNLAVTIAIAAALHQAPAQAAPAGEDAPRAILEQMRAAAAHLHGYKLRQLKRERFGDKLGAAETMEVKVDRGRVYLHILTGSREGAEAIYAPGWNGGKVRIHKGSFPDVTLNLDPHGSMLMDRQHHPIEHAGFAYVVRTLLDNVRRADAAKEGQIRLTGETLVGGKPADVIELGTPLRTTPYVVQKGETAWTLAERFQTDPYVLVHHSGLKGPDAVSAGKELRVPSYYGSRTVLSVDRATHLPSRMEVYDGKNRLYELYEWTDVDLAPLREADFDPKNPAYHF